MESGFMRWVFRTRAGVNSIPYVDEQRVYFGSNDGRLYAVDRETGEADWSFDTGRPVQSTVIRYEDRIIFSSDGGAVHFVSLQGEELDRINNPIWYRDTFQVVDGVMYLARGPVTNPRSLGAYDLETGEYYWVLETATLDATWYSFAAVKGDKLYMSTNAFRGNFWDLAYYAFDVRTGARVWEYRDTSQWSEHRPEDASDQMWDNMQLLDYMAPALWRDHVIFASGDTVLRAFDRQSGAPAWQHDFGYRTSSTPVVAGDRVYVGIEGDPRRDQAPRLMALSARNGRVLWEIETDGAVLSAPVIAGRWMVFGTDANFVYVLEELIG
jgi:outer membrane protein assembly factor BamB